MPLAIITGITGQDGSYLSKLLLEKGYSVVGLTRSAEKNIYNHKYLNIQNDIILEKIDIQNSLELTKLIEKYKPDEFYNLAAQSSVSESFKYPNESINYNVISVLNILEAIRMVKPDIRFYQASSSEMFGKVFELPVTEQTRLHPLSPYAISKASAHWITINYREAYGLHTCCGVLFNHDSFLRPETFFTKKVIKSALAIKGNTLKRLEVGNIEVKRDFGYAPKYVEAMHLMLNQNRAEDYLICSGESIYLKDIILHIFKRLNISEDKIVINPALYRPTEIEDIYGAPYKAKVKLGWKYELSYFEVLDIILEEEIKNQI